VSNFLKRAPKGRGMGAVGVEGLKNRFTGRPNCVFLLGLMIIDASTPRVGDWWGLSLAAGDH